MNEPVASTEYYFDRSQLFETIRTNPYELVSSTLHNNEFSPSTTSLYDLMQKRTAHNSGKNFHQNNRINAINSNYNTLTTTNSRVTSSPSSQSPKTSPAKTPHQESLPLVKNFPNKILGKL